MAHVNSEWRNAPTNWKFVVHSPVSTALKVLPKTEEDQLIASIIVKSKLGDNKKKGKWWPLLYHVSTNTAGDSIETICTIRRWPTNAPHWKESSTKRGDGEYWKRRRSWKKEMKNLGARDWGWNYNELASGDVKDSLPSYNLNKWWEWNAPVGQWAAVFQKAKRFHSVLCSPLICVLSREMCDGGATWYVIDGDCTQGHPG